MELLSSRKNHIENTVINVGTAVFGNGSLPVIAGPCTIESEEQLNTIALAVKKSGAQLLRAGAYKPRTSPYSFQGLGYRGLELLSKAKELTGLPTVSEIMDADMVNAFDDVDIIQVGAKNMQNFPLLKRLSEVDKPILLKRGAGNTIEELLLSSEYILQGGNNKVILCERGIRSFDNAARFTFDINAIPLLKERTHLPVIGDPSHGTGISSIVTPVAFAAVAAGADGLLVEVHNNPAEALCDGQQALTVEQFDHLITGVRKYEEIRCVYK